MSLNGLDAPSVKEAHDAAVVEPGGWFLLKYASRDEIELLGRGNGGIVEIRNGIAQYEDNSPLYGFLRYRRRNVIIKFMPEDCSRLVQARATVHFNSVCDHFSPFDTSFTIANAKELKDTKLSAACSLHAASGSTSSSTSSLRRRRLMEIAEEEEEGERERKRQSVVKEEERPWTSDGDDNTPGSPKAAAVPTSEPPVKLNADLASSPEASNFSSGTEPPSFIGAPPLPSPTKSFDDTTRRLSSQSARADIYGYSSFKPRVKLGPRPSADLNGRPRTSAGTATYRPVSTIPAGFKISSKVPKKDRPQEQDEGAAESPIKKEPDPFLAASPPKIEGKASEEELARPRTSSGASNAAVSPSPSKSNFPAMPLPPATLKQSTMTPEKARLLKAMKLREKKKMMSLQPTLDLPTAETPSEPTSLTVPVQSLEPEASADSDEASEVVAENDGHLENRLSTSKADSGIGIDVGTDQASVDTHSDSHPASPMAASSDIGDSTQASSLSESTDETVLAVKDQSVLGTDSGLGSPSLSSTGGDSVGDHIPEVLQNDANPEEASELMSEAVEEEAQPVNMETEEVPEKEFVVDDFPAVEEGLSPPALPTSRFSTLLEGAQSDLETTDADAQADDTVEMAEPSPVKAADEEAARSPQIRIPVSKFSTQESKLSPANAASPTVPSIVIPPSESVDENVTSLDAPSKEEGAETGDAAETASIETRRSKSGARLEPIRTGLTPHGRVKRLSVASLSDDNDLMDELQSATLQQAKPILVSKSPISPFFSSDATLKRSTTCVETSSSTPRIVRTVSNPIRGPLLAPGDVSLTSARAVSSGAAFLHKITQQQEADLRPKSSKLGSSISQRIKALEKLSGSTGGPEATPKERPSSTFFSVRKTSGREPSRSPSVVDRANSLTRAKTVSPPESGESSPEAGKNPKRGRKGSMVSRLSVFEGGNLPRGRPESIQVTARIVRDPTQPFPKAFEPKADPVDFAPLDLKDSPLLVDLQNSSPSPAPVPIISPPEQEPLPEKKTSLFQRRLSKERRSQSQDRNTESAKEEDHETIGGRPRRRSSMTVVKDFIKDRRDSLLGGKSPSTDNLSLNISSAQLNLASPAMTTSSRSPSRPPSTHHNISFPRRLSISSRRSSIEQKSPALTTSGPISGALSPSYTAENSGESEAEGKNGNGLGDLRTGSASGSSTAGSVAPCPSPNKNSSSSRTSRFMRRLSNSLGSGRKNITPSISPTVTEEDAAEVAAAGLNAPLSSGGTVPGGMSQPPSIVAYMGDVNVQFPDNLLWKRRAMCLDSQGFVILSTVQGTVAAMPAAVMGKDRHHQAGAIKRYHMSDFKPPYTPEMEVQELPNSVVLDFVDGSGLQIACEDRAGQMNVLHILEEAHQSHTSFGQ
ncbi:hypothetical protein B0H66DRAFT_601663 [Apodospora peruviana]|uniref:Gpi-anchored cell surface glycoprotein n=1 Tax=Apodospora peruviana TaxID=516989 RepID=A0AAE0IC39_9PEZI|nr:hypothetical protein B0H66DRAFT_601663 [Apodospora peruviana]